MFIEIIVTYAIMTNCTMAGICDPGAQQVPIRSVAVGHPYEKWEDCAAEAKRDTVLAVQRKPIAKYRPGPRIGGYQTFLRPMCVSYEMDELNE